MRLRRTLLASWLLLAPGCDTEPTVASTSPAAGSATASLAMHREDGPTSAKVTADAEGTRAEVVLVVLGKPFPKDLLDEIETQLRDELQVEVRRHERIPLPKSAYYRPRRRYRAEKLLDHLLTLIPEAPETTRVLGLTTHDISTTKGEVEDWGIFGLGLVPGQAAVISMHRLKRSARSRKHLRFRVATTAVHEIGHTLGLDHCPEERCPMQDAEGSIANTDSSTGHLGPQCRAALDERFPLRSEP
ncbi:MAG: hypothetical protein AAF799_34055 [Myxococcota bacterium]